MANSLLDFVMSLLRDPDAAAAYAADPGQTIADAHLTDVTSVDVNNLIPVVSESLSMAVPSTGADTVLADHASNVWTSGAATAAFDAFDDHVPAVAVDDVHSMASNLVTEPDAGIHSGLDTLAHTDVPDVAAADDPSLHFEGPVIDDAPAIDVHDTHTDDWSHTAPEDHHLDADHAGFDIFDT
ncbi:hypothetical protein Mycsm_00358 [Mycobacterium sp. JS623]|uniref:Rv0340 family IniB-related protein n=1 Tax=Mycobacterium sp. JS623 TaxID=212767 RepID=UPI0002A58ADA|nr:IniB N-terminal domain-containing protein [Mycobacterium sp. JS623]AGB20811.1 hypothetical protein Mycsm_00358 [Mycobacterium sp. JS623]